MKKKPNGYWTNERIQEEAYKFLTRGDFFNHSQSAYRIAQVRGILDVICAHMGDSLRKPWTDKELEEEALKYMTRNDFQCGSRAAYQAARKLGEMFFLKICSHMPIDLKTGGVPHNFYWTEEKIHEQALKYSTRAEFQKGYKAAYQAAVENGILDKVCSHMVVWGGTSLAEKELFAIIKNVFPNAKKLRDRKVKIENKPYIRGFDIDVLVGKFGIEFDGKYYHSFEVMRADPKKSEWSDDDVKNYHEIKDAWFATKGIKILHVKEEEWIVNKQVCIQRCLEFLAK